MTRLTLVHAKYDGTNPPDDRFVRTFSNVRDVQRMASHLGYEIDNPKAISTKATKMINPKDPSDYWNIFSHKVDNLMTKKYGDAAPPMPEKPKKKPAKKAKKADTKPTE